MVQPAGQLTPTVITIQLDENNLERDSQLMEFDWLDRIDVIATVGCTLSILPYTVGGNVVDSYVDEGGNAVEFVITGAGSFSFAVSDSVSRGLKGRRFQIVADAIASSQTVNIYFQIKRGN